MTKLGWKKDNDEEKGERKKCNWLVRAINILVDSDTHKWSDTPATDSLESVSNRKQ